jgi:hypothetical protein
MVFLFTKDFFVASLVKRNFMSHSDLCRGLKVAFVVMFSFVFTLAIWVLSLHLELRFLFGGRALSFCIRFSFKLVFH